MSAAPDWLPVEGHDETMIAAGYINVRAVQLYRYLRYKPDGARQMKKPGRWQVSTSEYGGWTNCDPPDGSEWQPCPDLSKRG